MTRLTRACRLLQAGAMALALTATAAWAEGAIGHRAASPRLSDAELAALFKSAKPMEKILTTKPAILSKTRLPVSGGKVAAPAVALANPGPAGEADAAADPKGGGDVIPRNYGAGNLGTVYHYSDYLVSNKLRKLFPYRATGYFFFNQLGGSYYCTGSLISKSILLVAGHCVHAGNNSSTGWDTSGYFVPAGSSFGSYAPYNYANAVYYWTWTAWYQTGALDQGYDVGLVVLNNRVNANKPGEIGTYTGWLGFCTGGCLQTYWFLSQLGYPGNYYGGNNMTEGQHLYVSDSRDYVYGSGMQGGSSGGPHIANIGDLSDSSSNLGQWPYRNITFAPTSWGYTDPQYKIQGSSALTGPNNTFDFIHNLFNPACSNARSLHGTGSCSLFP